MRSAARPKYKHYSSDHLSVAVKHFCKRLHDRFGIGCTVALHRAIVQAILAKDESRVRFVRDQPNKTPSSRWSRELRQEWLINICDRYIIVIYCPKSQTLFTCYWATSNIHTYRAKEQAIADGGLLPFVEYVNKMPTARVNRPLLH